MGFLKNTSIHDVATGTNYAFGFSGNAAQFTSTGLSMTIKSQRKTTLKKRVLGMQHPEVPALLHTTCVACKSLPSQILFLIFEMYVVTPRSAKYGGLSELIIPKPMALTNSRIPLQL